jgi:hypothetical protein
VPLGLGVADVTLGELLDRADAALGPGAAVDLSRDVIVRMTCPACGTATPGGGVVGTVREAEAACPQCGTHRAIEITSSIRRDAELDLSLTAAELGLPPFDIVVARQGLERQQAWLFDRDAGAALGPLAASYAQRSGGRQESAP